jgi:hypothetical protein
VKQETLRDIKVEATRLRAAADRLEALLKFYDENPDLCDSESTSFVDHTSSHAAEVTRETFANLPQAEACFLLLAEARRPLSREEIINRAAARGKVIKSPELLSPVLSRDDRFVSVGGGRWDLSESMKLQQRLAILRWKTNSISASNQYMKGKNENMPNG